MLTSENSIITISVQEVFGGTPQQLSNFATDDMYDAPEVKPGEAVMGTDGILTAAALPVPIEFRFMLMADSPSITNIMEPWFGQEQQQKAKYVATVALLIPQLNKRYSGSGFLTSYKPAPKAGKFLSAAMEYGLTLQSFLPSPM
jgi:hypothetical protein